MIDPALREALACAARSATLLVASDYDGTLSPIVDDPAQAVPYAPALDALAGLAHLAGVRTIIISGRSVDALSRLTGAPDDVMLIGTHGAELPGTEADPELVPAVGALIEDLRRVAARYDGTLLEPKPTGAALHYRHALDEEAAAGEARTVGARFGARVLEGKKVVELVLGTGDKGTAIDALRRRWSADCVVFFGDDTTDEDVFSTLGGDDVGVKVGTGETQATFRVDRPEIVAEALELLLAQRRSVS